MKRAYIITSAIEATTNPLTYSPIRSVFSAEERLRQTLSTVITLDRGIDTDIYVLDTSETDYSKDFGFYYNLKFIHVKKEFPSIHQEVTTHANKSRCETLMTKTFLEQYRSELSEYDAIIKLSGRYLLDRSFSVNELGKDKIVFKKPWGFPWQDWWGYDAVKIPGTNDLKQYCSVVFAWGQDHFDTMLGIYNQMSNDLAQPDRQHYDIETLLYFYTRPYVEHIVETDWLVYGWLGPNGKFVIQ